MLDENEKLIEALFSQVFGFVIEKIPEAQNRTADFFVSDGFESYLIEVKTRRRSVEDTFKRNDQLESRGYAETAKRIERRRDVSKILSEAVDQIESTTTSSSKLKLVFVLLRDFDAEERWQNIVTSIYGIRNIIDAENGVGLQKCYYFSESDFYRYRKRLDGVILLDVAKDKAQLCLNDHSVNFDRLGASALTEKFGQAVVNPPELERSGKILIVKDEVDRADEHAVIASLRDRYGLSSRTMQMGLGYYSSSVIVPCEIG